MSAQPSQLDRIEILMNQFDGRLQQVELKLGLISGKGITEASAKTSAPQAPIPSSNPKEPEKVEKESGPGDCRLCRGAGRTACQPCRGRGGRIICSFCNGNGRDPFKSYTRCTFCNGTGNVDCVCMALSPGSVPGHQLCPCSMTEAEKKQEEEKRAMGGEILRGMTDMGLGMFKNSSAISDAASANATRNLGAPAPGVAGLSGFSGFGGLQ